MQSGMNLICRLAAPRWPPGGDEWQTPNRVLCGEYLRERDSESSGKLQSLVQWDEGNYE